MYQLSALAVPALSQDDPLINPAEPVPFMRDAGL